MKSLFIALISLLVSLPAFAQTGPRHAIAMHGTPKYPPGFTHFDYVNPDAPKGGVLRTYALESFDSLNPFIVKGVAGDGIGLIYQSLMEKSSDEPFTMYGSIAQSIEIPEDRSWVMFTINPAATWHDGVPITAQDVEWTFNALIKDGMPFYRSYYGDVDKIEIVNDKQIKFIFKPTENRELPLILAEMTVLPKHFWTAPGNNFAESSLTPPLGSGAYKVGTMTPGRSIEYARVPDWWAKDLPINRGRWNFDRIVYDYYRDRSVALEAFLGGAYDFRQEFTAKHWATGYESPNLEAGRIKKDLIHNGLVSGMQGFTYNIRRPVFQDRAVRRALDYAFDYEWSNKQYAYGAYTRSRSYFNNSDMEAKGTPGAEELALLEPYRGQIPDEVFTKEYRPAQTDGSGNNRENLKEAARLLDEAGWKIGSDGVREKDGVRLEFEFLTSGSNSDFERWILPFFRNLQKLGVKAGFRVVDSSQYVNRVTSFDFDMLVHSFAQSLSPGNEQRDYWKSHYADVPGSRNVIGVKNPAVDALVEKIVASKTREELVTICRALDRVLQWEFYTIPNWHIPAWRIAYWDKFGKPSTQAPYALDVLDTWWVSPAQ